MENKKCISCHELTSDKFYSRKCAKCYNFERNKFYHVKKKDVEDLMFINNAINHLKCCEFNNNENHKKLINDIIFELENIINYNY